MFIRYIVISARFFGRSHQFEPKWYYLFGKNFMVAYSSRSISFFHTIDLSQIILLEGVFAHFLIVVICMKYFPIYADLCANSCITPSCFGEIRIYIHFFGRNGYILGRNGLAEMTLNDSVHTRQENPIAKR